MIRFISLDLGGFRFAIFGSSAVALTTGRKGGVFEDTRPLPSQEGVNLCAPATCEDELSELPSQCNHLVSLGPVTIVH